MPGAIAKFEHALMSERTRGGLAAARARECTGGQKAKLGHRQPGRCTTNSTSKVSVAIPSARLLPSSVPPAPPSTGTSAR
ncbi:hypothetical protein ACFXG4_48330 [Nocardia sp. NPDC059246]|uniref:hypothetical protein n=1 Tax=unclassified Nocardia TaxID=2637762 RepID=UPI0036B67C06